MLTSPRVVVDADGEFLYIPADRALAARAQRQTIEVAHAAAVEFEADAQAEAEAATVEAATVGAATVEVEAVEAPAVEAEAVDVEVDAAAEADARAQAIQREAVAQAFARAQARQLLVNNTSAPAPTLTPAVPDPVEDADPAPHQPAQSVPASSTPEAEMTEGPYDLEVAIANARLAARRRAVIMALLFVATVTSWVVVLTASISALVAVPATVLLVLHALASRVAGLRSRETLMMIAVQVRSTEVVQSRPQRQPMAPARTADDDASATRTPDRVARRAAAVGASTWEPVPVPPPTYTLKPAVHRPEPAPLDLPAAPAAAVSRGALPRRAADIERILALESHLDELFEEPKVVNG